MLKLVIRVKIKKAKVDEFIERSLNNAEAAVKEKGCYKDELYQDIKDPTVFVVHEEWESYDDLAAHNEQAYVKEMNAVITELVDGEPEFLNVKRIIRN